MQPKTTSQIRFLSWRMLYKSGCNSPMLVRFFRILRVIPMLPEISGQSITIHIYITHRIHVWYNYLHLVVFMVNAGNYTIHGSYGLSPLTSIVKLMWPQQTLPGATSFTVEKKDFRIHLQLLGFLWVHIGERTCWSFNHQKSPFPCLQRGMPLLDGARCTRTTNITSKQLNLTV